MALHPDLQDLMNLSSDYLPCCYFLTGTCQSQEVLREVNLLLSFLVAEDLEHAWHIEGSILPRQGITTLAHVFLKEASDHSRLLHDWLFKLLPKAEDHLPVYL